MTRAFAIRWALCAFLPIGAGHPRALWLLDGACWLACWFIAMQLQSVGEQRRPRSPSLQPLRGALLS
eukprot:3610839-Alexandrium_andersonii.AAC.1